MTSCEALGHDVQTYFTEGGDVIYRHGSYRIAAVAYPLDRVYEEQVLREQMFDAWLQAVHARDGLQVSQSRDA